VNISSLAWTGDPMLQKVNSSWKELFFCGRYRLGKAYTLAAIRHIYAEQHLPEPGIIYAEDPLHYLQEVLAIEKKNRKLGRRRRLYSAALDLSSWYDQLLGIWERAVQEHYPQFRLLDPALRTHTDTGDYRLPVFRRLRDESDPDLAPVLEDCLWPVMPALWDACHTILRKSLLTRLADGLDENQYRIWTGAPLHRPLDFRGYSMKEKADAIWSWLLDDLHHILPIMPLYDFFRNKGILRNESFDQLSLLFQSGVMCMAPFRDCCVVCVMPVSGSGKQGMVNGNGTSTLSFGSSFHVYMSAGIHYPANWLGNPAGIDLATITDHLDAKRLPILEQLLHNDSMVSVLPMSQMAILRKGSKELKVTRTSRELLKHHQPLYYLMVKDLTNGDCKTTRIHGDMARKIRLGCRQALTKDAGKGEQMPAYIRKLLE
jgi:hypothetical protein